MGAVGAGTRARSAGGQRRRLRGARPVLGRLPCGRLLHEYPIIGADLVRLALAVGDADRAQEVCAAVADVAARNDVPSLGAVALRCRGLTDHDIDALEAAADAFARGPWVLDTALTIEDIGVATAAVDTRQTGARLLDNAAHRFEQLDTARDLLGVEAAFEPPAFASPTRATCQGAPRVGEPHSHGAHRCPAGRRRTFQPADRRSALRLASHGADPPLAHLHQVGHGSRFQLSARSPAGQRRPLSGAPRPKLRRTADVASGRRADDRRVPARFDSTGW